MASLSNFKITPEIPSGPKDFFLPIAVKPSPYHNYKDTNVHTAHTGFPALDSSRPQYITDVRCSPFPQQDQHSAQFHQ